MHKSEISGYVPNIMSLLERLMMKWENWVLENFIKFAKENSIDLRSTEITLWAIHLKKIVSDIRNTKVHELAISLRDSGFKLRYGILI